MNKKQLIVGWAVISISLSGCAMKDFIRITEFTEVNPPASIINASKEEIRSKWGKPDRIYTKHSRLKKYDADELWIYRPESQRKRYRSEDEKRMSVSEGVDDYIYFKNNHLIKIEYLVWGDF